jgi:nucleoside-diphosphate-sugar epimerase
MEKTRKNTVSILGCGWLGLPLAEALVAKDFRVNGSTTTTEKMPVLESKGIQPFQISLSENGIDGNIADFLVDTEILIIDVPPKLRGENKEDFVAKIKHLIRHIEKSSVKKVLFVSSTSVYADDNTIVTEETIPNPETDGGKQLLEVEILLQKHSDFRTTILRFGGLIGSDRHPIKHLAGKEHLENPDAPINLIHQEDCIGILLKIIEQDVWDETFNAATPLHSTRQEYYHKKAQEMNLAIPKFTSEKPSMGKIISSKKIETVLGYSFNKDNL